jgi:hypothetical protein
MYVDTSSVIQNGKTYVRHLLRESYREDGRVKHRTVANLSQCASEEIEAIRLALRHKGELATMLRAQPALRTRQGRSVGAVWTAYAVARRLGIEDALGTTRAGRLALWQVLARVIDQGSRLSAVRLAGSQAATEVLGLAAFDEDDLYANLDWLAEQQAAIEKRLFERCRPALGKEGLFLYDVTSSYLEGTENELAAFGYNRDGKRGKKQIVIGLLTTGEGEPVAVEVFKGNTADVTTFGPQIDKVLHRFDVRDVTFVGDRGMIKSAQIEALGREHLHYITAITKPQIETLLASGTLQMDLFDQELAEVTATEGVRYIVRRNPARAAEVATSRADKLARLQALVAERNGYLRAHRRAALDVALRAVRVKAESLRIDTWVSVSANEAGRSLTLAIDEAARAEEARLDGCYVLKTDLPADVADTATVHSRYKDLALVESAFRTCKTLELQVRPIYVRLASRTRGHVLVVALAYRIVRELARLWRNLDATVQEGLDQLAQLCATELLEADRVLCVQIPQPRPALEALLKAADVQLPQALPGPGDVVTTKRKLPDRRKKTD